MPDRQITVPVGQLVDKPGNALPELRSWLQLITGLEIISGAGSPEGVVSAKTKTLYMNESGIAGSILYIKRDSDIGGDDSQGWILV